MPESEMRPKRMEVFLTKRPLREAPSLRFLQSRRDAMFIETPVVGYLSPSGGGMFLEVHFESGVAQHPEHFAPLGLGISTVARWL